MDQKSAKFYKTRQNFSLEQLPIEIENGSIQHVIIILIPSRKIMESMLMKFNYYLEHN